MTERDAWIAFSGVPHIGPVRFKLLVNFFGSALDAWEAPKSKYLEIGFKEELAERFENFKNSFNLLEYKKRMEKFGVEVITCEDEEYPEGLKQTEDYPYILYVRKDKSWDISLSGLSSVSLAVVGSRKMTRYGEEVCQRIVSGLVSAGVTIVSGLALGIDSVAHKTAVELGGKTIAVLGGGLDDIYPSRNKVLGETIVKNRLGMLISEFSLGYPAMPQNFPTRNRIVSGIALGVIIVEGAARSGTLLTASNAAAQGREVFAVPGPVTSPTSKAPNYLIKNGAKLVESAQDVLEELNINSRILQSKSKSILPGSEEEKVILDLLTAEGLDIDTVVRISGMEIGLVLSSLTTMELKGMVRNIGGVYIKADR